MKQLLSFFFAISFFSGYAQIEFEDHIVDMAAVTTGANDVKSADIDGDGNIDILSSSGGDNKIAWYRNLDGQGTFGFQHIISSNAQGAKVVEVADLDGDGDLDVISASASANKIAWYENLDGLGIFSEENIVTSTFGGVSHLELVDLDGDGYIDILAGNNSTILWFKHIDGLGNFETSQSILQNVSFIYSIYVQDLNNDGDQDILYTIWDSTQGEVRWVENIDGQGTFGGEKLISILDSAYSVYATDMDNDSDIDVIASGLFSSVVWYENIDGQGNFIEQLISNSGSQIVYAADINGDGKMDVLSGIYHIYWHQNIDGQGNFAPRELITEFNETLELQALDWNDLDNDGLPDLLSASSGDSKIAWYKNLDGNGNFGSQRLLNDISYAPASIFAADLDTDGDKDVLSTSISSGKVFWYRNINGQGSFGNEQLITDQFYGVDEVFVADIDSDQDMDVVSSSREEGEVVWFENINGQGNFSPKIIIDAFPGHGNSFRTFVVADIDQDGDLDVVCTGSSLNGDNRIFWKENDGQGNFNVAHLISDQFIKPMYLAVADLNSNGKMDVIAANNEVIDPPFESKISWFENLGSGNFGVENILVVDVDAFLSIEAVDLDGDGFTDIKTNSANNNEISWYKNINGAGDFGSKKIIQDSYMSWSSVTFDLDEDGDLDVISGSSDNNGDNRRLVWYEHLDGQGTFGDQQVILLSGNSFPYFYPNDIDGDGDMDILYAYSYTLGWLENLTILSTDESSIQKLFIYPNPTSGLVKINAQINIFKIEVYNTIGQLMVSNYDTKEINISSLERGMYIVKMFSDNGQVETKKILKK